MEEGEQLFVKKLLGERGTGHCGNCERPKKLLPYWGWLLTKAHTEAIEFFLSLISIWFALITLGASTIEREKWSPLSVAMNHILPLSHWAVLLFIAGGAGIIGLAFRVAGLRLLGLSLCVGFWLCFSSITAYLQFYSPAWGGYAIIGLTASWACIRMAWETSDPLIAWARGWLEARGHVWSTKHK